MGSNRGWRWQGWLGFLVLILTGIPSEVDAACWKCKQSTCTAWNTGYQFCSDFSSCGPGGCVQSCSLQGSSCSGGCVHHSPEGECLQVENKSSFRIVPNGEEALAWFELPPRRQLEPNPATDCGPAKVSGPAGVSPDGLGVETPNERAG